MKPQFTNQLVPSFIGTLSHQIWNKGSGFTNTNVTFYPISTRLTNKAVYASPYKGFVWDSSASGAIVPSGISGVGGLIPRGLSGLSINWNEGQAIFSGAANNLTNLSGVFSISDFNIIYTNQPEESILFDTKWQLSNPTIPQGSISGLAANEKTFPAIIVKYYPNTYKPFEFGGREQGNGEFRCIVISDNDFKLDAVNSVIGDMARTNFGLLYPHEIPFNVLGDIKSGDAYNYTGIVNSKQGTDLVYIDNVYISPMNEKLANEINPNARISIIDLEVRPRRHIRA